MSTKAQLIDNQIKHIHEVRKEAFEEVLELMDLKYWDNEMIKKYIQGRIKTQGEAIAKIENEADKKEVEELKQIALYTEQPQERFTPGHGAFPEKKD